MARPQHSALSRQHSALNHPFTSRASSGSYCRSDFLLGLGFVLPLLFPNRLSPSSFIPPLPPFLCLPRRAVGVEGFGFVFAFQYKGFCSETSVSPCLRGNVCFSGI